MTRNADYAAHLDMTPEILYEDNHLLVAVKPPGVLSQADGSQAPDMLTLLKKYLKDKYQKPGQVFLGLVHRLDRPAGGVMVFARTSKAAARLSQQIRDHQVAKTYLAIIDGVPDHTSGIWRDKLVKDTKTNQVHVNQTNHSNKADKANHSEERDKADQGKEAWLRYKVLQTVTKEQVIKDWYEKEENAVEKNEKNAAGKNEEEIAANEERSNTEKLAINQPFIQRFNQPFLSLIAVRLGSGRGHQIRVQLASRDLPILGDRKYHPDFVHAAHHGRSRHNHKKEILHFSSSSRIKRTDDLRHEILVQAVPTVCLWSVCMGFYHPTSRQWLSFTAWPPEIIPWLGFARPDSSVLADW